MTWKRMAMIGLPVIAFGFGATSAVRADPPNLVANGDFENLGDTHFVANGSKEAFSALTRNVMASV